VLNVFRISLGPLFFLSGDYVFEFDLTSSASLLSVVPLNGKGIISSLLVSKSCYLSSLSISMLLLGFSIPSSEYISFEPVLKFTPVRVLTTS